MSLTKVLLYFTMDMLETFVFVGSIFIVCYIYLVQPNQVKGISMVPTFHDRDYIFTNKLAYRLHEPAAGDIIVFNAPRAVGQDYDVEYIKRIIAVPGDTVMYDNCQENTDKLRHPRSVYTDCDVVVNGQVKTEPYISHKTDLTHDAKYTPGEPITVPPDTLFVMGDNRPDSVDSRIFGPVPQSSMIGVVFFRYFPLRDFGPIPR